jgi:hypothetical protein
MTSRLLYKGYAKRNQKSVSLYMSSSTVLSYILSAHPSSSYSLFIYKQFSFLICIHRQQCVIHKQLRVAECYFNYYQPRAVISHSLLSHTNYT